jgi:hypothetical protein
MRNYAGVACDIFYTDNPTETHSVYMSFGKYNAEYDAYEDANDTAEGLVYFYVTGEEWEQLRTGEQVDNVHFVVDPATIEYVEVGR